MRNIIPLLNKDIATQGKPDGYTLGGAVTWINDDGIGSDMSNSLKLNGDGNIFTIINLGGLTKGHNSFECYIKGTVGSVVTLTFGALGDVVFTVTGAGWNKFELSDSSGLTALTIPDATNFITITTVASSNTGNDISISGMRMKGD